MLTEAEELELLELEEAEAMAQGGGPTDPQGSDMYSASPAEKVFPTGMAARQKAQETGSMWDQAKAVVAPAMDVLSLPSRAIASMRGQAIEDPNAFVFKPEVEKYQTQIDESLPDWAPKGVAKFGVEMLGRGISDPLSAVSPAARAGAKAVEGAGRAIKGMGPDILRRAVKPSRPSMRAWNPPDFEIPLRERLVTKFGGLEKAGQNIQSAVEGAAEAKDAFLRTANIRLTGSGAINEARKGVVAKVGRGSGLSATEVKSLPQYMEEAFETAKSYPSFKGGKNGWSLSGNDAVEFRKWMDKQTTFDKAKELPARASFYRELRKSFENQIDNRMGQSNAASRGGTGIQKDYLASKKQLAELVPIQKAFEERLLQDPNNYAIGLRETALLGGAVASGNLGAATAKAGIGVAINRLLNRPGGAAILYEVGSKLEASPMRTLLLSAADAGKLSAVSNRILDALARTEDEERKAILEARLMKELGSSFEARK